MLTPSKHRCLSIAQASCSRIAQAMPYVRNVRTDVTTTHLSSYLTLVSARRGAARFDQLEDEKTGDSRGLKLVTHA